MIYPGISTGVLRYCHGTSLRIFWGIPLEFFSWFFPVMLSGFLPNWSYFWDFYWSSSEDFSRKFSRFFPKISSRDFRCIFPRIHLGVSSQLFPEISSAKFRDHSFIVSPGFLQKLLHLLLQIFLMKFILRYPSEVYAGFVVVVSRFRSRITDLLKIFPRSLPQFFP